MKPDEELCLCFHVTCRKVVSYLRVEKPKRVGQLADCFGAGTGCGWCRPFLKNLFEAAEANSEIEADVPDAKSYARMRQKYIQEGKKRKNEDESSESANDQGSIEGSGSG